MTVKKKRFSRVTLRVMAWSAGAIAFAVPWAAFRAIPTPTVSAQTASPQVVIVPAGSKVVVLGSPAGTAGVKIVRSKASAGVSSSNTKTVPIATTGASAPPP